MEGALAGFWSPYEDMNEAQTKLCRIADAAGGGGLGVSFSDGRQICVLRQARRTGGRSMWLNVLATHVAAPPPPPPAPNTLGGKLKAWFWRAMEIEGEAEIQQGQAQLAAGQAIDQEFYDHVWEPTHQFLLHHKLVAEVATGVLDVVGVAAAVVFVIAVPELVAAAAAGSVLAGACLVTGGMATIGTTVLVGLDAAIYGADITGHKALAKSLDDSATVGWIRIGATLMLLPDLPVSATRALVEIGETSGKAGQALTQAAEAGRLTSNASRDLKNVTNPGRHPQEVARQMDRVRKFAQEAAAQSKLLDAANSKIRLLYARNVALFPAGTAGAAGQMVADPPKIALNESQKQKDEDFLRSVAPAKGMPRDVKLQMRVIGYSDSGRT